MEENPLVYQRVRLVSKEPKYGPKCGKPRISFWWCFAFAIEHQETKRIQHRPPKLVMAASPSIPDAFCVLDINCLIEWAADP
ncbi:12160_t:CDS:2 [Funneliformis geosporum]|uniref:12160_t:CDS:1 n=1 Tax=Funneliformis geosporum TaxID=1117311 RepID=A0A9W4WPJ8_9GLOM|nr:12160_t:CDS:2 [Funneliformis geosporum]